MLLVKTKVDRSSIHGLGLFADQDISQGDLIWEFNPLIDKEITREELSCLPLNTQNYVRTYSYLEKGKYILCGDNARFTNHSVKPNVDNVSQAPKAIAARDIKQGEEITEDYRTYDDSFDGRF